MRVEMLRQFTLARLARVDVEATVKTAALAFSNRHIGLLVVCKSNGEATGVVSKSDLVRHLARTGAADEPVADLMSHPIISCDPNDDLYFTWQTMTERGIQNMPVLTAQKYSPLGILDVRDALKVLLEQEEYQETLLTNYIAGVGYQ